MDQQQITKWVTEVEELLALIKKEVGIAMPIATVNQKRKKEARKRKPKGSGSTKPTLDLVENAFFSKPRTATEVKSALAKKALFFKSKDIAVTLMRLVRSDVLEREGDGNPWSYRQL